MAVDAAPIGEQMNAPDARGRNSSGAYLEASIPAKYAGLIRNMRNISGRRADSALMAYDFAWDLEADENANIVASIAMMATSIPKTTPRNGYGAPTIAEARADPASRATSG
jgi:hypothetical protein